MSNPLSLNLYTYVLNNPLRYIDPSGNFCVSADGNWSHAGLCKNTETSYWFEDKDNQMIVSNGMLVGKTGPNGKAFAISVARNGGVKMNYWGSFNKPATRDPGPNAIPEIISFDPYKSNNNFDTRFQFDGDFVGTSMEYQAFEGGIKLINNNTGVVVKVEFGAGAVAVGAYCDTINAKCFIGADVALAGVTIGVYSPLLDSGYYLLVEGGVVVGAGAKASYTNGVVRVRVAYGAGFQGGIGITKNT